MPATFMASGDEPGENARYTFTFNAKSGGYTPGVDDIVVTLHEDFQIPSTIHESTVVIQTTVDGESSVTNPASVVIDGEDFILELGDLNGPVRTIAGANNVPVSVGSGNGRIEAGEEVIVIIRSSAGVANPTEAKAYGDLAAQGDEIAEKFTVVTKLSLGEDDGGRGDVISATGKGFKNGTTMTVLHLPNNDLEAATLRQATALCSATVSTADVGACEFTITSPLFEGGDNYIAAFDGKTLFAGPKTFVLKPSVSVNPGGGSPGESILVQLNDFDPGQSVSAVRIANRYLCYMSGSPNILAGLGVECSAIDIDNDGAADGYQNWTPGTGGTSSPGGELNFRLVVPNNAPQGIQVLGVDAGGEETVNIVIGGPSVTSTPSTVLPNQRISLVATGFTAGTSIDSITIAGSPIPAANINGNQPVNVDNGGNWSASVDLPMNNSTIAAGDHAIRATDSEGRTGQVTVTIPERTVTITPDTGRVGTIAVVRGTGFPSKNDEGRSFNVEVVYETGTGGSSTVSSVPDASGRFEVQLRVPTTAAIPSTNTVRVSFNVSGDQPVVTNVTHNVPEGVITLSQTSGGPGSTVTISGEGFKSFVPVRSVSIASLDISPAPHPSTDVNGMLEFDVLIPGLEVGIQTIEVRIGQTTASTGFTVTESGINPGDIKPVAEAVEPLGDALDVIWHFNNDTKEWTFYDGMEGGTLSHTITGETYLILVKSNVEAILNRDTRSLTCVGGNCWN
ncbi:MAG: hypothetical protein OXN21_08290, partial [Chloroflexota bacterium]|nr:hypothetical protein [Chloroflexota bacterium]